MDLNRLFLNEDNCKVKLYYPCNCGCDYRGKNEKFKKKYKSYLMVWTKTGEFIGSIWLTEKEKKEYVSFNNK